MQLKNKLIYLTILFIVLFGAAGGANLWLMQKRLAESIELNAAGLLLIERIRSDGLEMIGSVENLAAIQMHTGALPMRDVSGADELLVRFGDSFTSMQKNLEELGESEEQLFCTDLAQQSCGLFLSQFERQVDELHSWGAILIGSGSERTFPGTQEVFSAKVIDFVAFADDAVEKQQEYSRKEMNEELTHSRQMLWNYCIEGLAIVLLAIIVVNRFSGNIMKRLEAMENMVEKAGENQFFVRLRDDEQDELGQLARKMDETVSYLAETRQAMKEATRDLAAQLKESRAVKARLAEAATHDSLTGLPNRVSFFEQFNHAIALADRQNEHIALLFLDMDGLKIVNDAFGHDGGDILIRDVGKRLKENIRKSDYAARLAGDEFVVILENLLNIDEDVRLVCAKLLEALAEPYDIRGRRIKLTASIGVSLFPDHGNCADLLLHKADSAMYQVKNGGKNNFAVYEVRDTGKS
jgi:diguanylate cyclase (GGDEF)-like protein